jgi:hypothetical protein
MDGQVPEVNDGEVSTQTLNATKRSSREEYRSFKISIETTGSGFCCTFVTKAVVPHVSVVLNVHSRQEH